MQLQMPHLLSSLIALILLKDGSGVRITRLHVPTAVLNGSVSSLTLDCEFEVSISDRVQVASSITSPQPVATTTATSGERGVGPSSHDVLVDSEKQGGLMSRQAAEDSEAVSVRSSGRGEMSSGLVVKWFLDGAPEPVYQWIPGYRPQAFGVLRGRVNLSHVASDDPLQRHRAVHVIKPAAFLSGQYTCRVTTWTDVASASKNMVIYVPARSISLWSSEPQSHNIQITCHVQGIFPDPDISLIVQGSQMSRTEISGDSSRESLPDGSYEVTVTRTIDERQLPAQCLIYCRVKMPGTTYSVSEKILHIRGAASHSSSSLYGARQRLIGRPLQFFPDEVYSHSSSESSRDNAVLRSFTSALISVIMGVYTAARV